jgi:hypothetical protein
MGALEEYYSNLLIIQYHDKPRAVGTIEAAVSGVIMDQLPTQVQNGFNLNPTIQTILFSDIPASGSFIISYQGFSAGSISWNDTTHSIEALLNAMLGVRAVTVTGSIAEQSLVITWNSNQAPTLFTVTSNTLKDAFSSDILTQVDTNIAQGVQLDVLGKYVGVTRSGFGTNGPVLLDDADFYRLIQLAIISNNSGSSLATIVGLLSAYFPDEILCFDYANISPMRMGYLINTSLGSAGLIQLFVAEEMLPHPMGVQLSVAGAPTIDAFFGFCDYVYATQFLPNTHNSNGFNCAASYTSGDYSQVWPWIDYSNNLL